MSTLQVLTLTSQNCTAFADMPRIDGNVVITCSALLPELVKVTGDIIVEESAHFEAPALQAVGGAFITRGTSRAESLRTVGHNCYAYKGANLDVPALETVGGGLFLYPETHCVAPRVTRVGGGVSINAPAELSDLAQVEGGLVINAAVALPALKMVGDYLYAFAHVSLPSLLTVSGDLVVYPGGTIEAGRLTSVGARLVLQAPGILPMLSHVGGDLYATVDAELPGLGRVGGTLNISPMIRVEMPNLLLPSAELPPVPLLHHPSESVRSPLRDRGVWAGRQWAALGSSVTIFGAYTHPLAELLDVGLTNLSVGGGALSTSASSAPGEVHAQIAEIPIDADLVTFEVGMVDFRTNARLGQLYDTTLETFYGALYRAIVDTLAAQPRRTLVFLTPIGIASPDFEAAWNVPNANGDRFEDFSRAILEVCRWCGIAVIDCGRDAGIGGPTLSLYTADGIHLNQAGGLRLAQYLYRQLQMLLPFPTLPGGPEAGPGSWSLQPIDTATILRGTGVQVVGSPEFPGDVGTLQQETGYYFSALWLSGENDNAIEFVSLPSAGNSLWLVLACGPRGWVGTGDFGNFGAQRLALFEQGHGSVTFGPFLSASYSIEPNEAGMRWRIERSGNAIRIYQQRPADGFWVEACHAIRLDGLGFDPGYFSECRLGILATHGSAREIRSGRHIPAAAL